jgi:hypothetical protein
LAVGGAGAGVSGEGVHAYTVKPRPVVRMVPSAVCRAVSAGPPAVTARAPGAPDGAGPYGPAPGPPEAPHAAATVAAAAASAAGSSRR